MLGGSHARRAARSMGVGMSACAERLASKKPVGRGRDVTARAHVHETGSLRKCTLKLVAVAAAGRYHSPLGFTPRRAGQSEQVAKQVASAAGRYHSPLGFTPRGGWPERASCEAGCERSNTSRALKSRALKHLAQNLSNSRIGTGRRSRALRIAASSTHCVLSASSKSGIDTTGDPPATMAQISAAWLMKPCS